MTITEAVTNANANAQDDKATQSQFLRFLSRKRYVGVLESKNSLARWDIWHHPMRAVVDEWAKKMMLLEKRIKTVKSEEWLAAASKQERSPERAQQNQLDMLDKEEDKLAQELIEIVGKVPELFVVVRCDDRDRSGIVTESEVVTALPDFTTKWGTRENVDKERHHGQEIGFVTWSPSSILKNVVENTSAWRHLDQGLALPKITPLDVRVAMQGLVDWCAKRGIYLQNETFLLSAAASLADGRTVANKGELYVWAAQLVEKMPKEMRVEMATREIARAFVKDTLMRIVRAQRALEDSKQTPAGAVMESLLLTGTRFFVLEPLFFRGLCEQGIREITKQQKVLVADGPQCKDGDQLVVSLLETRSYGIVVDIVNQLGTQVQEEPSPSLRPLLQRLKTLQQKGKTEARVFSQHRRWETALAYARQGFSVDEDGNTAKE